MPDSISTDSKDSFKNVAVVIPVYNEAATISLVMSRVPSCVEDCAAVHVVVVDDGSDDDSSAIAYRCGATVLSHSRNQGLGAALRLGLEWVRAHAFDAVVTLDGDGEHDPRDLPRLVAPILRGSADAVIGSRLLGRAGMEFARRLGNQVMNLVTHLVFGLKTTDSQSGYRALSRKALEVLELCGEGMEFSSLLVGEIAHRSLGYVEVPIGLMYPSKFEVWRKVLIGVGITCRLIRHRLRSGTRAWSSPARRAEALSAAGALHAGKPAR